MGLKAGTKSEKMRGDGIKAVVVLSGGQDSATALALALRKHGAGGVAAITFEYGQRHSAETRYARRLVRRIPALFGAKSVLHKVVRFGFYSQLTTNALLDHSAVIGKRRGAKCPTTVVEGRNAFFLLAAAVWAKTLGAKDIYIGVSEADFSGYPDCRAAFIKAQEKAMRLALDWPVKIVAPFMTKTKAEEWALAKRLGILDIIRNETLTCYNGVPGDGCGKCPACKLRNRGYAEFLKNRRAASSGKPTGRLRA
jgi:7-cyano-7-deazaguanine synthase